MNTYTTGPQSTPAVASGSGSADFVVAWQSGYYGISQDGNGAGVFARRFDNFTGVPAGPEFQVNTYTTGQQLAPAVSSDPLGNFVVVIGRAAPTAPGRTARRPGSSVGSSTRAARPSVASSRRTPATGQQGGPSVASDGDGNFVVAWRSGYYGVGQDGSQGESSASTSRRAACRSASSSR